MKDKHLKGIYRLHLADGTVEDHEGYGVPGMMDYAMDRGAVKLTDPRGHVHGQIEMITATWEDAPDNR